MKDIQKHYGEFQALKDINFNVKKGEIVVVCGPSGSGKSTMIRCINKLEKITSGTIVVNNQDINDKKVNINKLRQQAGMVFQNFNLPSLSPSTPKSPYTTQRVKKICLDFHYNSILPLKI